jgi:eukaryotic-like serine/threonine-protein kinase
VSERQTDVFPALLRDGKTVAYSNFDANIISTLATDNSGKPQTIVNGSRAMPNNWSKGGRYLVYRTFQRCTYFGYLRSSRTFKNDIRPRCRSSILSRWQMDLLHRSRHWTHIRKLPGHRNIVASFPKPSGRIQISNRGGAQARWRADGKKLYFIGIDKKLMAVSIDTSHGKLEAGVPHALFQTRIIAPRIRSLPVRSLAGWQAFPDQFAAVRRSSVHYRDDELIRLLEPEATLNLTR